MAFHLSTGSMPKTSPSVWVVDDDEDDRLFIRSAFEDLSHPVSVRTLNDGDQLIPQLIKSDELPKLILMDINMHRQNGFETLTQLRNTPKFSQLPVVMLTTSSDASDHRRSMALGANQCLTKPAFYTQLVSLLEGLSEHWALA